MFHVSHCCNFFYSCVLYSIFLQLPLINHIHTHVFFHQPRARSLHYFFVMKQGLSYFSLCLFFSMRCTTLCFNPPHSHARCTTLHTFAHTFVALFPLFLMSSNALLILLDSFSLLLCTLISLTDVRNVVG